jgi:hypothetical protein
MDEQGGAPVAQGKKRSLQEALLLAALLGLFIALLFTCHVTPLFCLFATQYDGTTEH